MFTVASELFCASVPVAAALPLPKTHPLCGAFEVVDPTTVLFSTVMVVFRLTIAVEPFPPAYALPKIVLPVNNTSVLPATSPSFPPP